MSAWRHRPHSGAFPRENDSAGPRVRALTAFLRTGSASYTRTAIVMQWPSEPAPPTPPKEREKRDSLLCDGDTVDAVLGSVFD